MPCASHTHELDERKTLHPADKVCKVSYMARKTTGTMTELFRTAKGKCAAEIMHEGHFESHRGAVRMKPWDTKNTWCVVLYGNDGYKGDDNADRQARTKTYVHGLYFGFANMLTEGAVEFGTTADDYTWAIVLNLPKGGNTKGNCKAVTGFLHDMVWNAWAAQLSFHS